MAENGRRISKGAWERMNRAYNVHHVKSSLLPDGTVVPRFTWVLMPETTKANRKVSLRDRFSSNSKRARFTDKNKVGEHR
jgi:hypothetical protein